MPQSIVCPETASMQHQSHAQQIANFSFSAMLGVMVLMLVSLTTSEATLLFHGGLPQVDHLVTPVHITGLLALVSSFSRYRLMKEGIEENWGQNQVQFLLSTVIGVYIMLAWFVF